MRLLALLCITRHRVRWFLAVSAVTTLCFCVLISDNFMDVSHSELLSVNTSKVSNSTGRVHSTANSKSKTQSGQTVTASTTTTAANQSTNSRTSNWIGMFRDEMIQLWKNSMTLMSSPPIDRFIPQECPPSFRITDPNDELFRKKLVQRSPLTNGSGVDDMDEIVIVSPVSNAAKHLQHFFENLCSLSYPHSRVSIVLGEDSSTDGTFEKAEDLADELKPFFKRIAVVRLRSAPYRPRPGENRHEEKWQLVRRAHMAMSRNRLLTYALGVVGPHVRWVLWIDADVRHIPRNIVEHLLSANKSIVTPNCLFMPRKGVIITYDSNTWQETDAMLADIQKMKPDQLVLEGYRKSKRRFLSNLVNSGTVVPIDGVGGCVLLVEADLHRGGLIFPPFVFDHHIETEGLAKMAAKIGVRMYGLPSVNVLHSSWW